MCVLVFTSGPLAALGNFVHHHFVCGIHTLIAAEREGNTGRETKRERESERVSRKAE